MTIGRCSDTITRHRAITSLRRDTTGRMARPTFVHTSTVVISATMRRVTTTIAAIIGAVVTDGMIEARQHQ